MNARKVVNFPSIINKTLYILTMLKKIYDYYEET